MKKLMTFALAAVAVLAFSNSESMAQGMQDAYRYGVGFGYGTQFGYGGKFGYGAGYGGYGGIGHAFPYPGGGINLGVGNTVRPFGPNKNVLNPRFRNGVRGRGFNTIGVLPREPERPPYFALYPPVYYNGIVSRPYGVSPFATPPGILPTEMLVPPPVPQAISNPYFDQEITPASENKVESSDPVDNKSTHVYNPYVESITRNN